MKQKEIKQKIEEEKYIHTNILFEVVGKPKSHVELSLKTHIEKLKADKELIVIREEFEDVVEQEGGVWSVVAEVELLVKNLDKLTWLCMNYMPASVEIMGPEKLVFKARELTNWINDLLSKMHEIAFMSQQVGQQNKVMLKSVNALVRNFILLCIDSNITEVDQISKKVGVLKKDLEPVFEAMIKEGTLKKNGKKYTRK
ncbi:MAG: hypothetical protein KJ583_05775 [Nanoarchaeota archaeon]|nr:hypothetical protein [Nanoarchaeota archaeon]MBU1270434.1 hypothetical protein [Nanoarchaeota archaeon]MBU1604795.1 hypothetical protein [Nanoarchaeota archaeon]MBU2443219.1 hypothetical protein [Nanoarchaeota archaeon]